MLQRSSEQSYPVHEEPAGPPPRAGSSRPSICAKWAAFCAAATSWWLLPAAALVALALLYVMAVSTLYTATSTVLVDPRRANVVETNQSVLSNFGTDDATIESQTLLIQSVAILERVVRKLKLTR